MTEKCGFTGGQMLMAFLGGAAAGATVAILTSTGDGKHNRRMAIDKIEEGKAVANRIPDAARSAADAAKEAFEKGMAE